MSAVLESWRGSPLTQERRPRRCGSTSSAGTRYGPSGLNVSQHLPFDHCPPETSIWKARSETSLRDGVPGDDVRRLLGRGEVRAGCPITTPSSTSQSASAHPRGIGTSSNGPTTVFGCLKKMIGNSGGGEPDSAACAA